MTTDEEVNEAIRRAFRGGRDIDPVADRSIAKAFGRESKREPGPKELPLKKREFEATETWFAKESAGVAKEGLAKAIMRSERCNIFEAETKAAEVVDEFYGLAAEKLSYDSDRWESVARSVRAVEKAISGRASRTPQPARESRATPPATFRTAVHPRTTGRTTISERA